MTFCFLTILLFLLPKSPKVYYNNSAHMAYHPVKAEVTVHDLHSNGCTATDAQRTALRKGYSQNSGFAHGGPGFVTQRARANASRRHRVNSNRRNADQSAERNGLWQKNC